jgi:hypothetical protein
VEGLETEDLDHPKPKNGLGRFGSDLEPNERERQIMELVDDQVDQILDAEDVWDVWILCRLIRIQRRNTTFDTYFEGFLATHAFTEHWKTVTVDTEDTDGGSFRGHLTTKEFDMARLVSIYHSIQEQELTTRGRVNSWISSKKICSNMYEFEPFLTLVCIS